MLIFLVIALAVACDQECLGHCTNYFCSGNCNCINPLEALSIHREGNKIKLGNITEAEVKWLERRTGCKFDCMKECYTQDFSGTYKCLKSCGCKEMLIPGGPPQNMLALESDCTSSCGSFCSSNEFKDSIACYGKCTHKFCDVGHIMQSSPAVSFWAFTENLLMFLCTVIGISGGVYRIHKYLIN